MINGYGAIRRLKYILFLQLGQLSPFDQKFELDQPTFPSGVMVLASILRYL